MDCLYFNQIWISRLASGLVIVQSRVSSYHIIKSTPNGSRAQRNLKNSAIFATVEFLRIHTYVCCSDRMFLRYYVRERSLWGYYCYSDDVAVAGLMISNGNRYHISIAMVICFHNSVILGIVWFIDENAVQYREAGCCCCGFLMQLNAIV